MGEGDQERTSLANKKQTKRIRKVKMRTKCSSFEAVVQKCLIAHLRHSSKIKAQYAKSVAYVADGVNCTTMCAGERACGASAVERRFTLAVWRHPLSQ